MSSRVLIGALVVLAAVSLLVPVGTAVSRELADVFVTNFPAVQEVDGTVKVEGPIRNATLVRFEDIIVSPVRRSDTTRLIDGGVVVTDGYPYVVLSLAGQIKGEVTRPGSVGAILIPDESKVDNAFNERGYTMFPLEVESSVISGNTAYFDSQQPRHVVGFPRYQIKLWNTTDKTVEVDLFAYLTN